jgi:hypothetical protein
VVSELDFSSLIFIANLLKEDRKEALFGLRFDLGQDHAAINMEVVGGIPSNSLAQWQVGQVA